MKNLKNEKNNLLKEEFEACHSFLNAANLSNLSSCVLSNNKPDLLNAAPEDVILLERAIKELEMKKKIIAAKKVHEYPVRFTETSGWFTVVDDPTRSDGKRKIRKNSEENLWLALADWYLDKLEGPNMISVYAEWISWKETPRNKSNIDRIKIAWNSYYLSEPLSKDIINKPMNKITALELRSWSESLLKKHYPVDKKKFSRMFNIVNQLYEFASDPDRNIVNENLWEKTKKRINKDLLVTTNTPSDESQIFTNAEIIELKKIILEDLNTFKPRPTSAGLLILFLLQTGLRLGEAVGLQWTDLRGGRLYIRRQATNKEVKEWTKTSNGYRDIPLTDEALYILDLVREFNKKNDMHAEWIFQSKDPKIDYRLSYNAANNKLARLCEKIDSVRKSPHKLRKTCLSALLDDPNVNSRTIQRFAGHSDITTTLTYYNFDRSTKEEQSRAINNALSLK